MMLFAKTIRGEIINLNRDLGIAFIDIGSDTLNPDDELRVFKDDQEIILQVLESNPVISKVSLDSSVKRRDRSRIFNLIRIGDEVVFISGKSASRTNISPRETVQESSRNETMAQVDQTIPVVQPSTIVDNQLIKFDLSEFQREKELLEQNLTLKQRVIDSLESNNEVLNQQIKEFKRQYDLSREENRELVSQNAKLQKTITLLKEKLRRMVDVVNSNLSQQE